MNPPGKEAAPAAARRWSARRVLMCSPDYFEVAYAINPHMTGADGALNTVDRYVATAQWNALRREYEAAGFAVDVLPGVAGLPDMVFAANQTFPFLRTDGSRAVLLSRMRHAERAPEIAHYAEFFRSRGYEAIEPPESVGSCEGMGDLIWRPVGRVLFGGYGFRTSREALAFAAETAEAELVPLKLIDPRFYHLDTAFVPLDETRAMVVREAFEPEGLAEISKRFARLLYVPTAEAADDFAGNAHCPDGRNVLIEERCLATRRMLVDEGFRVRPVATSEFRKAGGSVFCLKMMFV